MLIADSIGGPPRVTAVVHGGSDQDSFREEIDHADDKIKQA